MLILFRVQWKTGVFTNESHSWSIDRLADCRRMAGILAGRLVTFKKEGLGRWTNLGVGMVEASSEASLFNVFGIDLGLGAIKVTFEDLIAAFSGSLLFIVIWWVMRMFTAKKKPE